MKYTMKSTVSDLLKISEVQLFLEINAPEIINSPMFEKTKVMSVDQIISFSSGREDMITLFKAVVSVANGESVEYIREKPTDNSPKIALYRAAVYNIDNVNGAFFVHDQETAGCVLLTFSKKMQPDVYGKVTCNGSTLPQGIMKDMEFAGGMQMLHIPVQGTFTEYDKEYILTVEDFISVDGVVMKAQDITIKTEPVLHPIAEYATHDKVALQSAREGIVLLKNENNLLPLESDEKIQLVGAESFRCDSGGAGRIIPRYYVRLSRAVEEYSQFVQTESADIVILTISRGSGENIDCSARKGQYYLTDEEEKMIANIVSQHKSIIAVINSGYPIDMRWVDKYNIPAVLWCGYPGMLGGTAVVEILDGRVTPSGKLPDTWSLDYYDIPASANFYNGVEGKPILATNAEIFVDTYYEEDIYVGYRYFETFNKPVKYPFGFGLSYTSFDIETRYEGDKMIAKVKNTGEYKGAEVVQVYVSIPEVKLEQPSLRLISFEKTKVLEPGEEEEVILSIAKRELSSYDEERAVWVMESGVYKIYVGNSIKHLSLCKELLQEKESILKQVKNCMVPPVKLDVLSKRNPDFPKGTYSGPKEGIDTLQPVASRTTIYQDIEIEDFVTDLSIEELARLNVGASSGWDMHEQIDAAGYLYPLENRELPRFAVADGNNGLLINKPTTGMACSTNVCASFNKELAYAVGQIIAEEAKEHAVHLILAPGMNIHRNPLNGRHSEYFSEDPYLAGMMSGYFSKGLEENGVGSCLKHAVANNCETARKRNHSLVTERALREIYLKAFEVAMGVQSPDSIMTGYNAVNGVFTAEDEEMLQGIFREEFGFEGYVMTDWDSYATIDTVTAVQAGNSWLTPGSNDDTYVAPLIKGVLEGRIQIERLRSNVRNMLRVVQKRTGKDLGVK